MPVPVKRYFSTMAGAPVVNGLVGSAITWLDACLVNGFNPQTPTALSHVAGVATATFAGAHGYEVGDVVALSGANEATWNDEFRVVSASTDAFTFAIAPAATTPATGAFAAKTAPLGWTKLFSGTNKAVYRLPAPYAQNVLRVQDDASTPTSANGRWAKMRGYESMTDIDTGSGLFPTVAQVANGLSLNKSSTADSTARAWWLVGDLGIAYWGVFWLASALTASSASVFGDTGSLRSGDAYASLLIGTELDTLPGMVAASNNFVTLAAYNATQAGKYYARSHTQTGSSVAAGMIGDNSISTSMGQAGMAYPHPPNNGLLLATAGVVESSIIRCRALPGLYYPLHITPLNYRDLVTDLIDLPGRTLVAVDPAAGSSRAQVLFDITGPWR